MKSEFIITRNSILADYHLLKLTYFNIQQKDRDKGGEHSLFKQIHSEFKLFQKNIDGQDPSLTNMHYAEHYLNLAKLIFEYLYNNNSRKTKVILTLRLMEFYIAKAMHFTPVSNKEYESLQAFLLKTDALIIENDSENKTVKISTITKFNLLSGILMYEEQYISRKKDNNIRNQVECLYHLSALYLKAKGLGGANGRIELIDLSNEELIVSIDNVHASDGTEGQPGKEGSGGYYGKNGLDVYFYRYWRSNLFSRNQTREFRGKLNHIDVDQRILKYCLEKKIFSDYASPSIEIEASNVYFSKQFKKSDDGKAGSVRTNNKRRNEVHLINKQNAILRLATYFQNNSHHWNSTPKQHFLAKLSHLFSINLPYNNVAPKKRSEMIENISHDWLTNLDDSIYSHLMLSTTKQTKEKTFSVIKNHTREKSGHVNSNLQSGITGGFDAFIVAVNQFFNYRRDKQYSKAKCTLNDIIDHVSSLKEASLKRFIYQFIDCATITKQFNDNNANIYLIKLLHAIINQFILKLIGLGSGHDLFIKLDQYLQSLLAKIETECMDHYATVINKLNLSHYLVQTYLTKKHSYHIPNHTYNTHKWYKHHLYKITGIKTPLEFSLCKDSLIKMKLIMDTEYYNPLNIFPNSDAKYRLLDKLNLFLKIQNAQSLGCLYTEFIEFLINQFYARELYVYCCMHSDILSK